MGSGEAPFPRGVARPALRALASVGVYRIEQLQDFTELELSSLHGMGPKAIEALREALAAHGLTFAPAIRSPAPEPDRS